MTSGRLEERDREIVRLYGEGIPGTELAGRYGVSRQRIDQILKRRGAVGADEARVVRARRRERELDVAVRAFLDEHGASLQALAESGVSRVEVEEKFALLEPGTSADVVRAALRSSGVLFDVNREEFNFGATVVEAGVWYVMARANGLQGDVPVALRELALEEMVEVADSLAAVGVDTVAVRSVLLSIASCRRQLTEDPNLTISKQRYDEERDRAVEDLGLSSGRGVLAWPPTSQTVMKRLGGGYWTDALASIGIAASSRGRTRGLIVFEEADYQDAIRDFLQHCEATGTPDSYDAFETWVRHEDRAGRQRPSGPSVRNFFGSWINAKRTVRTGLSVAPVRPPATTVAASVARTALHDANLARRSALDRLLSVPALQRSAVLATFVRDYMGEFEVRRRLWLRSMIESDNTAVARRLALSGLKGAQRQALESSPPRVGEVLTDMYLDRLLADDAGVRNADGWLHPDSQAQLDAIPDFHVMASRVMRELRNLFTHDSAESEARLTAAVRQLAELDGHFATERRLTRRFLSGWLSSEGAGRLASLSESVIVAWRAMLAAEAVQDI